MASSAALRIQAPRIEDDDPVLLAIRNAPVEDMPETEQERLDVAEARALGRFIPGAVVSRDLAARRPR
ncbi:MAG: hypothetical protein U0359_05295 [Byssovorax sp.]